MPKKSNEKLEGQIIQKLFENILDLIEKSRTRVALTQHITSLTTYELLCCVQHNKSIATKRLSPL